MEKLTWEKIVEATNKLKITEPHQFGKCNNIDFVQIPYLPLNLSDGTNIDAIFDKCRGKILCSVAFHYKIEKAFLQINGAMPPSQFLKIIASAGNLYLLEEPPPKAVYSFEKPKKLLIY